MGDIKLFHLAGNQVEELAGHSVGVEKSLQTLIERHLEALLGVHFLATEYSTGKTHGGRIDTLGIDENGIPVIIEYKRTLNENVINQGLYYLNWLLDHRGEFELLVLKKYGQEAAGAIEWSNPRLLCIAGDFTRYDEHAVQEIKRSIELIRYGLYGEELLLLELVNAVSVPVEDPEVPGTKHKNTQYKTVSDYLEQAPATLQNLFADVENHMMSLGDDVQKSTLKYYIAYKRIKNIASVEILSQTQKVVLYLRVDPDTIALESGFTRDVRNVGHYGTGDLEVRIGNQADLEKAKPLIQTSYEAS